MLWQDTQGPFLEKSKLEFQSLQIHIAKKSDDAACSDGNFSFVVKGDAPVGGLCFFFGSSNSKLIVTSIFFYYSILLLYY